MGVEGQLEILVLPDWHAGWGLHRFGGDEPGGVALKLVNPVEKESAVGSLGAVGGGAGELLAGGDQMGEGDGAGFAGGGGVGGEGQQGLVGADFDGAG